MKNFLSPLTLLIAFAFSLFVFTPVAFAGSPGSNPNTNPAPQENDPVNVVTWVYLEGALLNPGGTQAYSLPMRTDLNGIRSLPGQAYVCFMGDTVYAPAGQPFNVIPWFYNGNEGAAYDSYGNPTPGTANYPSTVIDWVLVSIRLTPDGDPVDRKAALLHADGRVEFVNGGFNGVPAGNSVYLLIEHRNHLIIMTPEPVPIIDGTLTYDFRNAQSYIFDPFGFGGAGQKELLPDLPGVYAMFAGNGCQGLCNYSDSDVNYDDRCCWEHLNTTTGSYVIGDYNMNGDCNFNDRINWEFNNSEFTTVP